MSTLTIVAVISLTVLLTEAFAWAVHRYVMHRWAWNWHRSHHEHHDGMFEKNDLFALVFSLFAIALLVVGQLTYEWLFWVGIGVCVYGFLYFVVHDGLTHGRWPFNWLPKRGYLKRLIDAHHLHHANRAPGDAVSYGFLYAPPVEKLRERLKQNAARRRAAAAEEGGSRRH